LRGLENKVNLYIDIDIGYGRTGVPSDDLQLIERLVKASSRMPKLDFAGFYCHAGHSYKAGSQPGRDKIHQKAMSDLSALNKQFADHNPKILYGDTPSCSLQTSFGDVDEITPGNFVFYDLTQATMGSCRESDIAVAMVCPVTGRYLDSQQVVIHGGAVHFSKDTLILDGEPVFGKQAHFTGKGWSPMTGGSYITSITQEHGVVKMAAGPMESTSIGDLMAFFPVHSCLTANLMKHYTTLDGDVIPMLNG
jgi:D-serine deaminase-like pyridoxal phosphate-dependent protein